MNSKTQFIQKSLLSALWVFPAFSSVFGMNREETPQEYLNQFYSQSESLSLSNTSIHRTSKGKEPTTDHSTNNDDIDYILRLIDKMEKTINECVGLKLEYLLGNVTEKSILSCAYKNNIPLDNKECSGSLQV
jgi:deoxyhypusine synthase